MLVSGGCKGQAESAADSVEPLTAAGLRWHPLGSWEGRGDRQTESFDVASGTLKLAWEVSNEGTSGGRLRVHLYSAISGRPLQTIVDTRGTGVDSAYVADEPRVSYLVVESEGFDWRLRLEEAVRGGETAERDY